MHVQKHTHTNPSTSSNVKQIFLSVSSPPVGKLISPQKGRLFSLSNILWHILLFICDVSDFVVLLGFCI